MNTITAIFLFIPAAIAASAFGAIVALGVYLFRRSKARPLTRRIHARTPKTDDPAS